MPKLNKKLAKSVEQVEATHGFGLIDNGKYFARLLEVRVEETKAGNPMWVAEFGDLVSVSTGKKVGGRQWWNLNLPLDSDDMPASYDKGQEKWDQAQELSAGRLKAFFEAFGYEVDSDTDEIIDARDVAVITVGTRTISQGARTGEKANEVRDIESAYDFGGAPKGDGDEASDY